MAAAAVTDVAPKKKKKSIFGMLHMFQRKKSKSREKKVRAKKWLCVCLKTSPSGVTEGGRGNNIAPRPWRIRRGEGRKTAKKLWLTNTK